jgi:hypothetical protein
MNDDPTRRNSRLSVAVVQAIADEKGRDPTEVSPLGEVIDPDALDALFIGTSGSISFQYEELWVTVRSNGTVTVTTDR